jgi:hypothetical protein
MINEEVKTKVTEIGQSLTKYNEFAITTNDEFVAAGEELKVVKAYWKTVDDQRKKIVDPLNQSKKEAQEFFTPFLDRAKTAESQIKAAIADWIMEQERIRDEAEREAREKAQHEQDIIDKKAAKQAERAEAKGDYERAEEILATKPTVSVPVVTVETPKVSGLSSRKLWKYRISASSMIPREYLIPNDKMLSGIAVSTQGAIKIPGVEFYSVSSVAMRG